MNRQLFLNGDINSITVQDIIYQIIMLNHQYEQKELQLKANNVAPEPREPIRLFINSPGGNVYDGFALIDAIRNSKTPIHTIALGSAMSMGMLIYSVGHKRYVGDYATLMFHDVSSAVADKLETIRDRIGELNRIQAMICTVVVNNSKVPMETLAEKLSQREDWYISAKEAIELGLADDYFKGF